jgi:hypothetical protein
MAIVTAHSRFSIGHPAMLPRSEQIYPWIEDLVM